MNPAKVVMHVVKRNGMFQVLNFLRECVSQTSESAHGHAHCEVLPLNVASGNVSVVRIATNDRLPGTHAHSGAVTRFWTLDSILTEASVSRTAV